MLESHGHDDVGGTRHLVGGRLGELLGGDDVPAPSLIGATSVAAWQGVLLPAWLAPVMGAGAFVQGSGAVEGYATTRRVAASAVQAGSLRAAAAVRESRKRAQMIRSGGEVDK